MQARFYPHNNMINRKRIVIAFILLLLTYTIGKLLYESIKTSPCDYKPLLDDGIRCQHLFTIEAQKQLKCFHSFGNANGAFCGYSLQNKYRFIIWELGEFSSVKTKSIHFHNYSTIKEIDCSPYRSFEIGGNPACKNVDIICFTIEKELNILAGGTGELKVDTITNNYLISSGQLSDLAFVNGRNEPQINISYEVVPAYSVLVFLKKNNTFFIILINSFENKDVPKEAIKFLKLD